MKVKNYIPTKEPIQVEIYIPNPIQKGRKEIQIIRRLLNLSTASISCVVEIEMKLKKSQLNYHFHIKMKINI